MSASPAVPIAIAEKLTPAARFYRLHREEQLAKKKAEYAARPDVIAARAARSAAAEERVAAAAEKKAAVAAEKKAARAAAKSERIQRMVEAAITTARRTGAAPTRT